MKGAKSSAVYVNAFRERMRQAGLVKKDVWIRPEHAQALAAIERRFRQAPERSIRDDDDVLGDDVAAGWTITSLQAAIDACPAVQAGQIEVNRIEGLDPALHLVMRDYGDLPVFVAVGGLQIIVQALMWPVEHVRDPAGFNAHVLRTHKLMPLTTLGIEPVAGTPCYIMFGSLDTHSSLSNVLFEIETLAENVISCVDGFRFFLRDDVLPAEAVPAW